MRQENNDSGKSNRPQIVVNKSMTDHSSDPFFAKKVEVSKKAVDTLLIINQLSSRQDRDQGFQGFPTLG